jgi:hypothetical protein
VENENKRKEETESRVDRRERKKERMENKSGREEAEKKRKNSLNPKHSTKTLPTISHLSSR